MGFERLEIGLVRLRINKENDRHGTLESEHDCIRWMLEYHNDEIQNLARDIAENGLSPIEGILVLPSPETSGDYIVWEGNRRIIALKLIDDPNRCLDTKLRHKFSEISNKAKIQIPDKIECTIAPSIEEADRLIELRHQGPQQGVGTLPWTGQQKSRHLERLGKKGRYAFSHQVVDAFSEKLDSDLREKVTDPKFSISTLDRLLSNSDVREFLGIRNEDGVARRFLPEKETLKGLTRILKDIANKMPVRKVYSKEQQKTYIHGFPTEEKPASRRTLKDSVLLAPSVLTKSNQPQIRSRPLSYKRQRLIPASVHYSIKDKRLNDIYKELRGIELKDYRNAVAVLFRVFVELSIELYLSKHQVQYNENDTLTKKAEKAINHMKSQNWADKQKVKGIQIAISNPNSILSFHTFNAYVHNPHFHPTSQDLATAWDNVQPSLDVLFNHLN